MSRQTLSKAHSGGIILVMVNLGLPAEGFKWDDRPLTSPILLFLNTDGHIKGSPKPVVAPNSDLDEPLFGSHERRKATEAISMSLVDFFADDPPSESELVVSPPIQKGNAVNDENGEPPLTGRSPAPFLVRHYVASMLSGLEGYFRTAPLSVVELGSDKYAPIPPTDPLPFENPAITLNRLESRSTYTIVCEGERIAFIYLPDYVDVNQPGLEFVPGLPLTAIIAFDVEGIANVPYNIGVGRFAGILFDVLKENFVAKHVDIGDDDYLVFRDANSRTLVERLWERVYSEKQAIAQAKKANALNETQPACTKAQAEMQLKELNDRYAQLFLPALLDLIGGEDLTEARRQMEEIEAVRAEIKRSIDQRPPDSHLFNGQFEIISLEDLQEPIRKPASQSEKKLRDLSETTDGVHTLSLGQPVLDFQADDKGNEDFNNAL